MSKDKSNVLGKVGDLLSSFKAAAASMREQHAQARQALVEVRSRIVEAAVEVEELTDSACSAEDFADYLCALVDHEASMFKGLDGMLAVHTQFQRAQRIERQREERVRRTLQQPEHMFPHYQLAWGTVRKVIDGREADRFGPTLTHWLFHSAQGVVPMLCALIPEQMKALIRARVASTTWPYPDAISSKARQSRLAELHAQLGELRAEESRLVEAIGQFEGAVVEVAAPEAAQGG